MHRISVCVCVTVIFRDTSCQVMLDLHRALENVDTTLENYWLEENYQIGACTGHQILHQHNHCFVLPNIQGRCPIIVVNGLCIWSNQV